MNKKYAKVQSTRRSLIMSILSLMLCFAMLIGTTYAWFTDSVTSGRNKIIAGNLDIALYHNGTEEINENTDNLFNVDLWEPGVICYENFTVKNIGTLALKYAFSLNIYDKNNLNGHDLSEVIKVAVKDGGFNPTGTTPEAKRAEAQALEGYTSLADFQKQGNLLAKDSEHDSDVYGVVLYWDPTDNDNLYNVNNGQKTSDNGTELFIEFGVNLVATQDTVESDSFDNQYDKFASFHVDFKKMTEKLAENGTEDLTVKKTGIIEEAKVPAKAANKVFDTLAAEAPDGFEGDDTTKELVLTLDVERQEATGTTQKYEIDMTAVMDFIKGNEKKTVTEKVENLEEYVTIVVKVESGLDNVTVEHNGQGMIKMNSPSFVPTEKVNNGYYYYNSADGVLTMKTISFSPFVMVWSNYLTVTPYSSPVKGNMRNTDYAEWFKFEDDKYTSVKVKGGMLYDHPNAETSQIRIANASNGDTLYITFENEIDLLNSTTGEFELSSNKGQKLIANKISSKKYSIKITSLGEDSTVVLGIYNFEGSFAYTIKIDHQENVTITTQPTANKPTVAATGDALQYQWYKAAKRTLVTNATNTINEEIGSTAYTTYSNEYWTVTESLPLVLDMKGLKKGQVICVESNGTASTEAGLYNSEMNQVSQIQDCLITVPADGDYMFVYGESTSSFTCKVTISNGSDQKLAAETGATLVTKEAGTYYCEVSNRTGVAVTNYVEIK